MPRRPNFPDANDYESSFGSDDEGEDIFRNNPYARRNDADMRRLMGLNRSYNMLTGERKEKYLLTPERQRAFDNIQTSTFGFRKTKIEQKKGIASEVIEGQMIPEEVLKNYPTVYLGSDVDIDYPLALGSRKIAMVDYLLKSPELQQELTRRIKALINQEVKIENNRITFPFNFGSGVETVTVDIEPKVYNPASEELAQGFEKYQSPQQIGLVLGFASQGPAGIIEFGDDIKSRLVENGVILWDDRVTKINPATKEEIITELGHDE
jgi:hypothetical protein